MVEANNNIEPVHQNLLQSHDPKGLQENNDRNTICQIITDEIAEILSLEIDKCLSNITDITVSGLVKQVMGKKIQISYYHLLKIVKPEVRQDIMNSMVKYCNSRRIPSED
ncbi:24164_t:CDS:1 [Dentiscutata erythropus]|uniref:24164_t:CDS:1 n=1 Tax=Dentiscutata erythropus TaxID=1348616 RepID=A0A9N9I7P1_9GLOM|nr:24164_t:CDS:1 [Dentiscutata erythropus]